MLLVTGLVILTVILFLWEPVRLDIIALAGFSNQATITILAMFILSEGIRRSGLMQIAGDKIAQLTGANEIRQLGVITGLSVVVAGIINNTPVVAAFIPFLNY